MWKISTAETKILIILCYHGIFGIIVMSHSAVKLAEQDEFNDAIQQYFVCEEAGFQMACNRSNSSSLHILDLQ